MVFIPNPDEFEIEWSSGPYFGEKTLSEIIGTYTIIDGWIFNGNELIDGLGRRTSITTGYIGNHGNIFLAMMMEIYFTEQKQWSLFQSYQTT